MRHVPATGIVLCLVMCCLFACQPTAKSPTSVPHSTSTPTADEHLRLGSDEAIALIKQEIAARGVNPETVRVSIGGASRRVSVRYATTYDIDGRAFEPQRVLIALAVVRVAARLEPAVDDGVYLAVLPLGANSVGLRVTTISGADLRAWAEGSLSDQEFVGTWTTGTVTRD